MKKIMIILLSILLVVSFVACSNDNSGPSGEPVVEPEKANELATTYLNAIDFSKLVVEASSEATGLTVKVPTENGFTVVFKDYKGDALAKNTEAKISSIKSGSIKFEFTTTEAKATANTYSAETVTPIVFDGADDGVNLSFSITGKATISYEVTYGSFFSGLTADSKVSLSKPEAKDVTLSIGNVTVDFADIEKDVTTGFGVEATVPPAGEEGEETTGNTNLTPAKAVDAAATIISAISRQQIVTDLMKGFGGLESDEDDVKNVTLDKLEVLYRGKPADDTLTTLIKKLLVATGSGSNAQNQENNLASIITGLAAYKDLYNITINISVSFDDYANAFKSGMGVYSITEGKVTAALTLGRFNQETMTLLGTYNIKTDTPLKIATNEGVYSISFSNLASGFSAGSKNDLQVTSKEDTSTTVSIGLNGGTEQSIVWKTLAEAVDEKDTDSSQTNFATKTAELLDAEYFYQNFGTLRFLKALNSAFTSNNGAADTNTFDGFKLKTKDISIDNNSSFNLSIEFEDYVYHTGDSNQTVTGEVTFTFKGAAGTGNDSGIFKVTSFTVKSSGNLELADTLGKRPEATTSLDAKGFFGRGQTQASDSNFISFIASDGKITGIKQYIDEDPSEGNTNNQIKYVQGTHEFVIEDGIESIKINLAKNN